jgi:hypothetical protein
MRETSIDSNGRLCTFFFDFARGVRAFVPRTPNRATAKEGARLLDRRVVFGL